MALTLAFSNSAQTVDGETLTYTDTTTYSSPARNTLALIMRVYHIDQENTLTRKELVTYDPTTATTFTLNLDQSADGIAPIDGVHKITLYALTSDKYIGITGGKYRLDIGSGEVDEDSISDADLEAASEDIKEAYSLPTPKLIQSETNIFKNLSDHDIDLDIPALSLQLRGLQAKRYGAQVQFQQSNFTKAARILEID